MGGVFPTDVPGFKRQDRSVQRLRELQKLLRRDTDLSSSLSRAESSQEVGGGLVRSSLLMRALDLIFPMERMLSICSRVKTSSVKLLTLLMWVCGQRRAEMSQQASFKGREEVSKGNELRVFDVEKRTARRGGYRYSRNTI